MLAGTIVEVQDETGLRVIGSSSGNEEDEI